MNDPLPPVMSGSADRRISDRRLACDSCSARSAAARASRSASSAARRSLSWAARARASDSVAFCAASASRRFARSESEDPYNRALFGDAAPYGAGFSLPGVDGDLANPFDEVARTVWTPYLEETV